MVGVGGVDELVVVLVGVGGDVDVLVVVLVGC